MKFGELATATATQVEKVRFYERAGLLQRIPASKAIFGPRLTARRRRNPTNRTVLH